jgi:hypothetical protein
MDKEDYLKTAPEYYMAAIAMVLDSEYKLVSGDAIAGQFYADARLLRANMNLFEAGIKKLVQHGVLTVSADSFGPTLYKRTETFSRWWDSDAKQQYQIVSKIHSMADPKDWLRTAVRRVNETYHNLGIQDADFELDATEAEWEPIPLDRDDQRLKKVIDAVDSAVVAIEGDNGYPVVAPGEREYVVENLKRFQTILRESTQILWIQVKQYGLEPLTKVIKRFGEAATGVAAAAAKQALLDYLKRNFTKILDWF